MELDRRLQLELKRKLFASRENNSKIEKSFVHDLGYQFQDKMSSISVQGGCDLIASNYYHPNGHTMPFLIGLEYATYRYLKLPAKYASHYSFVSKPAECSICFTDFTIQWARDEQGRLVCNDCALRPVKKKIKNENQKQLKRTIISCFTKEYGKISKTYERRRKRKSSKENIDPTPNTADKQNSLEEIKDETPTLSKDNSNEDKMEDKDEENSKNEDNIEEEKPKSPGVNEESVNDEPVVNESNEEPMDTSSNQETNEDTGGILDQLSKDDDPIDGETEIEETENDQK